MTEMIRLTQYAAESGLASKMGPCDLDAVLSALPRRGEEFARLLDTHDDAGVVVLDGDRCLLQSVDFFTPVVDTPYLFGQIAAANALSGVYAMGGRSPGRARSGSRP